MNTLWRWIIALLLAIPLLFSWLSGHGPSRSCGANAGGSTAAAMPAAGGHDDYCSKEHHMTMHFSTGSAVLSANEKAHLDKIAPCIDSAVEVEGHTDNVGTSSSNLKLSEQRAKAVVEYLVSKGVAKEHLVAKGYGEADPVASNDSADGRAKNRRIEFVED
jgi:outer membrane protein OmpA-like peptidoglycan-associated protein